MLSFASGFIVSLLVTLFIVRYAHLHEKFSVDSDLAGVQKFHARPVPRVGGIGILAIEWAVRGRRLTSEITWLIAVVVGLAQILAAVFPGTSRSAATILLALALGVARPAATEFSFLVGVPTLLAAGLYETQHALRHPGPVPTDWGMLVLGTLVSAVTAFFVVRWLIRWIQTHNFSPFGWYRIALGLAMLARVI